jgi:MATE family multidrug resistance protein
MWATIIGNVINVIVNYFLIYGIWIFPEMGIVGAAIGLSLVVMLVLLHPDQKENFIPILKILV